MATPFLVERDLRIVEDLLNKLDRAEFPVTAALWLYESETDYWDLIIASPLVDEKRADAYQRLRSIMDETMPTDAFSRPDVRLVSPKEPLIKGLRKRLEGRENIAGTKLRGPVEGDKGDIWIDKAYVYRA